MSSSPFKDYLKGHLFHRDRKKLSGGEDRGEKEKLACCTASLLEKLSPADENWSLNLSPCAS